DELEQTLGGPVETADIAVGVGIVRAVMLDLAYVDLADQGRDVLGVLIARLDLGDADLAQLGGMQLDDRKLRDVAPVLVEPFHRPWRHDAKEAMARNPEIFFEIRTVLVGMKQA